MTDADLRALVELSRWYVLVRPGAFGEALFGKGAKRSGNCSCPFARAGGKALGRLRAHGLAERIDDGRTHGWRLTRAGRVALEDYQAGCTAEEILCPRCNRPVGMHRDGESCPTGPEAKEIS